MRHNLLLQGAEAAVAANARDGARAHLEKVLAEQPDPAARGAALMLIAEMHQQKGDVEKALSIWNEVAAGPDKLSSVRARLARVVTLVEKGRIPRPAAIQELDALRAEWRGDDIELTTLRHLGAQRVKEGDWRGGFDAFRLLQKNFPDHPETKAVLAQAAEAVAELFDSPGFADMPPLRAFALFEQYREFLPGGARSDTAAGKLADRLADVDLLAQAASVLEAQLKNNSGDKPALTTRLASVRLRDRKPDAALAALDLPVAEVPAELAGERTLLKARALGTLGRTAAALALLGEDSSRETDQVRLEILSKAKDWKGAAPIFARLAPPEGKLDEEGAKHVLNWATAAALAGDATGIAAIRQKYGAAMDKTPHRTAFRLVVDDAKTPKKLTAAN
jgi:predicted negative regulator of RcsB-dependent stress response